MGSKRVEYLSIFLIIVVGECGNENEYSLQARFLVTFRRVTGRGFA